MNTTCADSDEDSGGSSDRDEDDGVENFTTFMTSYTSSVVNLHIAYDYLFYQSFNMKKKIIKESLKLKEKLKRMRNRLVCQWKRMKGL